MFDWWEQRRRRRILAAPFPDAWRSTLRRNMRHFGYLDAGEAARLCELVQVFVAEKYWEGCGGLEMSDEIRVTIAGQACLLALGFEREPYSNVETILVYPSTVKPRRVEDPIFAAPRIVPDTQYLLGEAHQRGPVILTWDAVRQGGRHPELGHNVVYHEFAHKLDMLDGAVDGVPPLAGRPQYDRWVAVCTAAYEELRRGFDQGIETFLDPYGLSDQAEFFAVVTEAFFDEPVRLRNLHPELYAVLSEFYRQETAERQLRAERGTNSGSGR
jgi:Mlc titration factor MtfA (ptsG expression regulator)